MQTKAQTETGSDLTWTDEDGIEHTVGLEGATATLARFYKQWPGGWDEVQAEQARAKLQAEVLTELKTNLSRTIYQKSEFAKTLQGTPATPAERLAWEAVSEMLEINIVELQNILAAVEKGL